MPLYVIRPANPAVGADWSAAVPGQYLYDITGITANLATTAGGSSVALDASGNARNGTYHGGDNTGWFQPGVVAGDEALLTGALLNGDKFWVSSPFAAVQWTGSWSFAMWLELPTAGPNDDKWLMNTNTVASLNYARIWMQHPVNGSLTVDHPLGQWTTAAGAIPTNGAACFVCVTWDGATLTPYIDGVAVAWASATGLAPPVSALDPPNLATFLNTAAGSIMLADEWAVWDTAISAGQVASMFAAAPTSFAAYTAAVIATNPAIYYHLDDGALNTGRQVTFEITDGDTTVALIPSGFPVSSSVGSFAYSWQPKLAASAQTAGGATTTVAIPKLILPAGYTVGARTLDLGAGDQWSNVAIWWDSTLMDALRGPSAYEYPPGAHLVYRQVGDGR